MTRMLDCLNSRYGTILLVLFRKVFDNFVEA